MDRDITELRSVVAKKEEIRSNGVPDENIPIATKTNTKVFNKMFVIWATKCHAHSVVVLTRYL